MWTRTGNSSGKASPRSKSVDGTFGRSTRRYIILYIPHSASHAVSSFLSHMAPIQLLARESSRFGSLCARSLLMYQRRLHDNLRFIHGAVVIRVQVLGIRIRKGKDTEKGMFISFCM